MKRSYEIFLDIGEGGCMAHVLGRLLGCNRTARNRKRALAKIREEIITYTAWLRHQGERVVRPANEEIELRIVEEIPDQDPWHAGGTNALFTPEIQSASRRDIDMCIRRMIWNRDELLKLVAGLSPGTLRRHIPGELRSMANTLEHIADAEIWYMSRLQRDIGRASSGLPSDPFGRLTRAREIALDMLRSLTPDERRRVFVPTMWCSPRQKRLGERWTARKVLRRFLEHERQHTGYIRRLLGRKSPA